MPDDVFDKLKKKKERPTVPTRDTALVKKQGGEVKEEDVKSGHVINDKPSSKEQIEPTMQTVRRAIYLEENIDTELNSVCTTEKIIRDNFIEAAYIACSENPELMQTVLQEAKRRYQQRKKIGEIKRIQTLLRKMNADG